MTKKLLMGNEAIALGAMRAGVSVVTGYPGTPSTEVLEIVAKRNDGSIYVEWSVNEKAALEVAAGAAFAGARVMVTMKQVGLNVASDPLMSLNYIGVKGGMVIVVADDPGPISSQNEQDTRHFAQHAKLALFDPSTPEEAYTMIADAFAVSEKYAAPVLFRPTTRVCHSCASVEILEDLPKIKPGGFIKDPKWVIFPRLAYANKPKIEKNLKEMSEEFSAYEKNILTSPHSPLPTPQKGIATGGVSYAYTQEALYNTELKSTDCKLFKISTFPFPEKRALEFLNGLDEVLVIEELDPIIENELIRLCGLHHLNVKILGKQSGHIQIVGENTADSVTKAIQNFLSSSLRGTPWFSSSSPPLPVRPPVLCAGCPHRASFFAVKEAAKGKRAVFSGDIGCYTLGNAQPLDMVDTCLCMGAGITMAQGLRRVEPDVTQFAFIGDSTFFHTGIPGIVNAVYNQTDIIVVVLDNSTTAMTGNQPHPGMGIKVTGDKTEKLSIEKIVTALNVAAVVKVNPFDQKAAKDAVRSLMAQQGVRVLICEAPCIAVSKSNAKAAIDAAKCTGCKLCLQKLGCPAISLENGKAQINASLCNGCSLCVTVCGANAIGLGNGERSSNNITTPEVYSNTPNNKSTPHSLPPTPYSIMIAGVGGQGTVLASKLIAAAAMKRGYDVRTTETIGMAQRGGSVVSHVRIGEQIYSPLIPPGKADALIAFEPAEAVRQLPYLRADGLLIVCDSAIKPVAAPGAATYEAVAMIDYLKANVQRLVVIDGRRLMEQCAKTLNVALLGVAAHSGIFPFDADTLKEVIPEMLNERFWEMNLQSFEIGKGVYHEHIGTN